MALRYVALASLLSGPKSKWGGGGGGGLKGRKNGTPWWPKGMNAKKVQD